MCDECNKGFHVYCLDPPIEEIPEESFYCKECVQKKEEERERF